MISSETHLTLQGQRGGNKIGVECRKWSYGTPAPKLHFLPTTIVLMVPSEFGFVESKLSAEERIKVTP